MEDMKLIIAQNIISLRRKSGMTQSELADKLNYTDKAVSKWERGESIPNVLVLKEIADLFEVTVDYLITPEEENKNIEVEEAPTGKKTNNRGFITGMSILLVWLVAACIFIIIGSALQGTYYHWISFIYAIPVSMIVWLIFNSIWFNKRRNFLIISFLMWTALFALYLTLLLCGYNIWMLFILGIPGQIIILMWSRLKFKSSD